jgi:glycosyltransferase involved in cell wall biosynthesis
MDQARYHAIVLGRVTTEKQLVIAQPKSEAPVTVVIAARNAAETLGDTIDGLGAGRDVIREIIVVDDGSTDNTAEVAATAGLNAGIALRVERRAFSGVGASRNAGMALAQSDLIYFIDADDNPLAGGLTLLVALISANPHINTVVGSTIVRRSGKPDGIEAPGVLVDDGRTNSRRLLRDEIPTILIGSFLLRRELALSNPFYESLIYDEDVCFCAGLLVHAKVLTVSDPVVVYNASEARAAQRLTRAPRRHLIGAFKALNALARAGADRDAVRWRKARLARRVGSKLVKEGRHHEALRFLKIASMHPAFRDILTMRYRVQAELGARLARPRRTPATHIKA